MDIVSRKAILRQLLAEARANKERAEQDADRVRLRVAEKVPVYADMSGAISRILIGASRRVLEDPAHGKEISAKAQREVLELKKRSEEALRAAGYTPEMLAPKYHCPICKDTGFVGEPIHEYCSCIKTELARRMYDQANVGEETFEHFDLNVFSDAVDPETGRSQRQVMQAFRQYCENYADAFPEVKKRNLLLLGHTGLGKTYMLNCIAARVLERRVRAAHHGLQNARRDAPLPPRAGGRRAGDDADCRNAHHRRPGHRADAGKHHGGISLYAAQRAAQRPPAHADRHQPHPAGIAGALYRAHLLTHGGQERYGTAALHRAGRAPDPALTENGLHIHVLTGGMEMGLSVSWEVVLFFALGMLLLYGVGWLLLVPLKKGLWFLFNSLVGGLLLWIAQLAGGGFGLTAVINPFSAILTGFLGLPGVALVLLIQNLL